MTTDKTYQVEYEIFIKNYKRGVTDGEEVGRMVARLAQFYGQINNKLADAETALAKIKRDINTKTDDSGKLLAVNRANIEADASDEARMVRELQIDLKNVEQYINSLKSLQKGILNEYSHTSNI